MPFAFPSHQGLIAPLWRRWPDLFDIPALFIGAAMPDVVDGCIGLYRGYLGQSLGHSLIGLFVLCLPGGMLLWFVSRYAARRLPTWESDKFLARVWNAGLSSLLKDTGGGGNSGDMFPITHSCQPAENISLREIGKRVPGIPRLFPITHSCQPAENISLREIGKRVPGIPRPKFQNRVAGNARVGYWGWVLLSLGLGAFSHLFFDLISHGDFPWFYPWWTTDKLFPAWWHVAWVRLPLPGYKNPYPVGPHFVMWLFLGVLGIWMLFRPYLKSKKHRDVKEVISDNETPKS